MKAKKLIADLYTINVETLISLQRSAIEFQWGIVIWFEISTIARHIYVDRAANVEQLYHFWYFILN